MTRIEKSIEIKAPPEKVWEMIAFDKAVEWMDEMEWQNVKYTSEVRTPEDKYRVGTSAHIIEKHAEYDCEITESIKNEKITFRSPSYNMIMTYILEPVEEETKFTYVLDYEFPYSIFGKIIDKLFFQRTTHKLMEKSLKKLKSILEK
ncbi:SRPBCC family protein [Candidatus Bathyarchaeota archaeon]|nr:SRPBCC family protein [Candidatus Bathyarchaeota archaeon]